MEKTTRMSSSVLVWRIISGVVDGHVQTNNPSYDGAAALRLGAWGRRISGYLLQAQEESSMCKDRDGWTEEFFHDIVVPSPNMTAVGSTLHGIALQKQETMSDQVFWKTTKCSHANKELAVVTNDA